MRIPLPKISNWAPILRWGLLMGALASSLRTMASAEMPYSMWFGIAAILWAGALGLNLPAVGISLGLFFLRYASFVAPVVQITSGKWYLTTIATVGFTFWESAPLWVAGTVGIWLIRRNEIPGWLTGTIVASLHLVLALWLPRPYYFSWGAPLLSRCPEIIWMFGGDMVAALLLGWLCVVFRAVVFDWTSLFQSIWIAAAPVPVALISVLAYGQWSARLIESPKLTHDVIAVQGGIPPFSGGFAVTSERTLTPSMLYSSLNPDLLLYPEVMVQVGSGLDPDEPKRAETRHIAMMGLCMAVPYSQVLMGARDWKTNRAYFTDVINGKPAVLWRDAIERVPFLDVWPKWAKNWQKYGFSGPGINPPESTPRMGVIVKDDSLSAATHGLKRAGELEIAMSGEIRRPSIVRRVLASKTTLALVNPSTAGWYGVMEGRGATLQANAKAMELGVPLYRVGQNVGTGLYVPWLTSSNDEIVKWYGHGIMRFRARLNPVQSATGFSRVFRHLADLSPLLLIGSLLCVGWIFRAQRYVRAS